MALANRIDKMFGFAYRSGTIKGFFLIRHLPVKCKLPTLEDCQPAVHHIDLHGIIRANQFVGFFIDAGLWGNHDIRSSAAFKLNMRNPNPVAIICSHASRLPHQAIRSINQVDSGIGDKCWLGAVMAEHACDGQLWRSVGHVVS